MPGDRNPHDSSTSTASLGESILTDLERLLGQHFELLRQELSQELDRIRNAGLSLGTGAGLTALGGILSTLMVVRLLHRLTRLPLWACYGLAAGVLTGTGATLLATGVRGISDVKLFPPPQTAETLREEFGGRREPSAAMHG